MTHISATTLAELGRARQGPCLSLFMPAEAAGSAVKADQTRLRKLLDRAVQALARRGVRKVEAERLVAPADTLIAEAGLWQRKGGGLAVYIAPGAFTGLRTSSSLAEQVATGPRFVVRPLLPLLGAEAPYYVLALSRGRASLLLAEGGGLAAVDAPGMPPSLAATQQFDDGEKQLQSRSSGAPRRGRGEQAFFGQGGEGDNRDESVSSYLRQVGAAAARKLRGTSAEIVLAAPREVAAVFAQVAKLRGVVAEPALCTPERTSGAELLAKSAESIRAHRAGLRGVAARRLTRLYGQGRAARGIEPVLRAAHAGRVSGLFLADDAEATGTFDPLTGAMTALPPEDPAADDLLDLAASLTLRGAGEVFAVARDDMPEAAANDVIAAVLRDK